MNFQKSIIQASDLMRAGRLSDAQTLMRQVLANTPDHAPALHLLGCAELQLRRPAEAINLIRHAIAIDPDQPPFHVNLALALLAMNRKDEAVAAMRHALKLAPDHLETNRELGKLLAEVGQFDDAIACLKRAVASNPTDVPSHFNLGTAYLRKVLATPQDLDSARNDHLQQAVQSFEKALLLRPGDADSASNLGNALQMLGRIDEAIIAWERAAASQHPVALLNLGRALSEKDRVDEALVALQKSFKIRPDQPELFNNLGSLFRKIGQPHDAIASFDRAISLQPRHTIAHSNRLYSLYFHPDYNGPRILHEYQTWNDQMARPLANPAPHENDRSPNRRLKVGYLSPNFREHSEAFFIIPLLANHDHQNFEIFCYSDVSKPDAVTTRLHTYADAWRDIRGMNDHAVADLIRRDKIDILIDLTMHMAGNRIYVFARKPAPIQVAWLAYPGTTGLQTMDYRLTDPRLDSADEDNALYTEKSLRLSDCWLCYDPLNEAVPAVHRPSGRIRFASLNNPCKNNEPVLRRWARVLEAVPDSTILILASGDGHRNRIRGIFQSERVDPQRVEFTDRTPRPEYLRLYDNIDICLDTLPYNGITTTCDALWMGVPVVTLTGSTACGRAGSSILNAIGLPELIATTEEEFTTITATLANDRLRLSNLRSTLRERIQNSPQMNAPTFARNVESAYRHIWLTWCK